MGVRVRTTRSSGAKGRSQEDPPSPAGTTGLPSRARRHAGHSASRKILTAPALVTPGFARRSGLPPRSKGFPRGRDPVSFEGSAPKRLLIPDREKSNVARVENAGRPWSASRSARGRRVSGSSWRGRRAWRCGDSKRTRLRNDSHPRMCHWRRVRGCCLRMSDDSELVCSAWDSARVRAPPDRLRRPGGRSSSIMASRILAGE